MRGRLSRQRISCDKKLRKESWCNLSRRSGSSLTSRTEFNLENILKIFLVGTADDVEKKVVMTPSDSLR
jgi:hypothetical protein